MKRDEFLKILGELQKSEKQISDTKGKEYAQAGEDVLLNFKEGARFLGITARQVCVVYMYKHFAAIVSYAHKGKVQSDSLNSRVNDLRLYAALMLALEMEEKEDV